LLLRSSCRPQLDKAILWSLALATVGFSFIAGLLFFLVGSTCAIALGFALLALSLLAGINGLNIAWGWPHCDHGTEPQREQQASYDSASNRNV
jgi:hypothetical protein